MPAPKKLLNNSHQPYRIGIDCRLAGLDHSGIGRYISQLVGQLLQLNLEFVLVLFCRNKSQADLLTAGADPSSYQIVITDINHYSGLEQIAMPFYYWRAGLTLLHVPHFNVPLVNRTPLVVTIHDLLWHQHRGTQVTTLSPISYMLKYLFYKWVVRHAIVTAQKILVPSQTIASTVTAFYPQVKDKIQVTYEGITGLPSPQTVALPTKNNYLLYVGNLYPHKNVTVILQALVTWPECDLIICGSQDNFTRKVLAQAHQMGLGSRVWHLGKVSDGQLSDLYQKAYALIQPSKSEGFGLTGLEAMAQNCPVVASRIPIFTEIYQQAVLFFDPDQPESLVTTLKQLKNPAVRQDQLRRQKQLITHYDWQKMTEQTLATYRSIINYRSAL